MLDRKLKYDCDPALRILCRCASLRDPALILSLTNYSPADDQSSTASIEVDLRCEIRLKCPGVVCGIEIRSQQTTHFFCLIGATQSLTDGQANNQTNQQTQEHGLSGSKMNMQNPKLQMEEIHW